MSYRFSDDPIRGFRGDFFFLSNMYLSPVIFLHGQFRCAEAAYQSCKCKKLEDRVKFFHVDGYRAKRLSKTVDLIEDWDNIRLSFMAYVVQHKFENPDMRKKMLLTGNRELIEENNWGDTFWGTVNGVGENHLGIILMNVRKKIQISEVQKQTGVTATLAEEYLNQTLCDVHDAIMLHKRLNHPS